MFGFTQNDSDTSVWLVFEGREYELSQFTVTFGQSVDHKGQPQHEVRGGRMMVTLTEAVPDNIYRWAMTSSVRSGVVEFRSNTANAPLKVEFTNGYCVGFERLVCQQAGLSTSLVISPEEVTVNGILLENRWV